MIKLLPILLSTVFSTRGGVGGMSGPRVDATAPEDLEAYHAGYDWNEEFGGRKEY